MKASKLLLWLSVMLLMALAAGGLFYWLDQQRMEAERRQAQAMEFQHAAAPALAGAQQEAAAAPAPPPAEPFVREGRKIGRNEPCPCGSGKKYKQCHGRLS